MLKPSTSKCLKSLLSVILLSVFLTACATNSPYANRGTVTGYTSIGTVINPSARRDEPNLKSAKPNPVPNMKLCFLTIKERNKPQIFTAQSGKEGHYSIELPEGSYIIRSDVLGECKTFGTGDNINDFVVGFFKRDGRSNVNSIEYDEKRHIVLDGEPNVKVKAGQTVKYDYAMIMEVY